MTFTIRFQSISDFKKYTFLFEQFIFQGYVKGQSFQTDADDILALFSVCTTDNMQLVLENYNPADIIAIEKYLQVSGLLVEPEA